MSRLILPSYGQGFAPRDGEPENFNLHQGLVAHWDAQPGNTGKTLFNWSRYGGLLPAALTSLTWETSLTGPVLDFSSGQAATPTVSLDVGADQSFTIAARIYTPTVAAGRKTIISPNNVALAPQFEINHFPGSLGTIKTGVFMADSDWNVLTANTWHDVAVSFAGAGKHKFYVDGKQVGHNEASPAQTYGDSTNVWVLGARTTAGSQRFGGRIAYWAIWDRVKTANQMALLHADPLALLRVRRRIFAFVPAVGGPYRAAAGQMFQTGAAAGETFNTGQVAGQIDGRSN